MRLSRSRTASMVGLALIAALLAIPVAPAAAQSGGANLAVIKDNEAPSNAEVSARLSEETDAAGTVRRVVISRDDAFADALASGLMQRVSPLLLVPGQGPVPDRIVREIERLGADSVTILGGTAAVGPAVESQLSGAGLTVSRLAGGSRIETAVAIAEFDAADATTAILARAFGSNPNDPSQGFADALGAGALAADRGWPILLSESERLSDATRAYLQRSQIREIKIVGGTAAVSGEVEAELASMGITTDRIAGPGRGSTALEVAKEMDGAPQSAADVAHVILVDGTGPDAWAGGFAAARRAAELNAPVLLADGVRLFPESEGFLTPGATFAQAGDLTVTCVVHPLACTEGRRTLGLIDYPLLTLDPPRGSLVSPGQRIDLTLAPVEEGADVDVFVDGTCFDDFIELRTDAQGRASVNLATSLPEGACQITTTYSSSDGEAFNRATVAYTTTPPASRTADEAFVASDVLVFGSVVPDQAVYVNDTISCASPGAAPVTIDGWAMQAQNQQPGAPSYDTVNVGSVPLRAPADATCTFSITPPPQTSRVFWGLYSFSDVSLRVPLLLGNGTTATVDLPAVAAQTGLDTRDVVVRWVIQMDDPLPSAPQPVPPGEAGVVNNPDGLPVVCNGEQVPQGLFVLPVGTQCTVSSPSPIANVLLVQPDRPIVSARSTSFTVLADTRWSTVRIQILFQEGFGGGESCASAMPLQVGRVTAGVIEEPFTPRFHVFDGRAGDQVRIRQDEFAASGLDPLLTLYGPDGGEVARNDDAEGALNSRIDVSLPVTGTYCVEAGAFSSSTGEYLLAVDPAPFFVDAGVIDEVNPSEPYTLNAAAGDRIVLEMRHRFPSDPTDPFLEIFDAAGNLIASDDDGGSFPNSRIEFDVPATGEYQVVATVFGTSYGPFTLEASGIAADGTYYPPQGFAGAMEPLR